LSWLCLTCKFLQVGINTGRICRQTKQKQHHVVVLRRAVFQLGVSGSHRGPLSHSRVEADHDHRHAPHVSISCLRISDGSQSAGGSPGPAEFLAKLDIKVLKAHFCEPRYPRRPLRLPCTRACLDRAVFLVPAAMAPWPRHSAPIVVQRSFAVECPLHSTYIYAFYLLSASLCLGFLPGLS